MTTLGPRQLDAMVNLAYLYPAPASRDAIYQGKRTIPPKVKVIEGLWRRGFIATDEAESGWWLTMLGWYHLVNIDKHSGMWYKSARQDWQKNIRKQLKFIVPVDVREELESFELPEYQLMEHAMLSGKSPSFA